MAMLCGMLEMCGDPDRCEKEVVNWLKKLGYECVLEKWHNRGLTVKAPFNKISDQAFAFLPSLYLAVLPARRKGQVTRVIKGPSYEKDNEAARNSRGSRLRLSTYHHEVWPPDE